MSGRVQKQSPPEPRWALVELSWGTDELSQAMIRNLSQNLMRLPGIEVLGPSLVQAAARGFGYDGSVNMTTTSARHLGAAIGCDYYILGRAGLSPQVMSGGKLVHRAWQALFIVHAGTGQLADFQFFEHTRGTPGEAASEVSAELKERLPVTVDHASEPSERLPIKPAVVEIEDPTALSSSSPLQPPRVLFSRKPTYTRLAQMAGITAIVELKVHFRSDRTIGPIEVVRWAGFGLDESAIEAARKIRFHPATLNGEAMDVRALVQYKFGSKSLEPGQPPDGFCTVRDQTGRAPGSAEGQTRQVKVSLGVDPIGRLDSVGGLL